MPVPILATKLYIPQPRPGIVPRPRLVGQLNEGLAAGCKLSLISASAGFGKTTLVSEWIAGCRRREPAVRVAWLSLDEADSDPARFLAYFVAALQTIAKDFGKGVLGAIQASQPLTTIDEFLLATLLNEIAAIPDHFILVLDDYHLIDSQPVDRALTFLLEHLPPQVHLVITTREDPPLPLARLRARGQLTELRAADLRFTSSEVADFLTQLMGLNLSAEDIAALEDRTEGWITGLQLAAIALRSQLSMLGGEDISSFIQAFTGSRGTGFRRFVLDYLVEEVLQRLPEQVRSFLLQTSILDRLCAALCDAVTGREDGKSMLDILERSNLFLISLGDYASYSSYADARHWYRYHHLFADVLQAHLMEAQSEQVSSLHSRASAWYERNGLQSDAIRHALAAKDFERAAGLIELAWPAAEEGSIQPAAWLGWVKMLPEELVHARPVLNVWFAYALLGRGEMEAAEARLMDAERWLEPADLMNAHLESTSVETYPESSGRRVVADQEQWKSLPVAIAVGRAYIAQAFGNHPATVQYASRALELPAADPFRHSQASMLLGMAYWASGDLEAANRVYADYTMKLRADGNLPDAIGTSVVLADIQLAMGRLREAIRTVERCLQFVMHQGEPIPFDTANLHRELCELNLEQGSLEAAAQHLQRSKELGEKTSLPVLRYRLCITQARLKAARGNFEGALALLDEAQRLYIRSPLPDFCPISAMKARIWVAQGRLIEAQGWARKQGLSVEDPLSYLREFEHITLARILTAQYQNEQMDGSFQTAVRFLDRLLRDAEEGGRMGSAIEILVQQALAQQAAAVKGRGNILPALSVLARALTLAEPEGYVWVFTSEGKPMAELLKRMEANGGTSRLKQYVRKLLSEMLLVEPESQPVKNKPFETLSERELEVLRLLRSELSGPEIAQQLNVSLNTLRTHTKNIFNKLGVNNRRAAVRRAEELDLF